MTGGIAKAVPFVIFIEEGRVGMMKNEKLFIFPRKYEQ